MFMGSLYYSCALGIAPRPPPLPLSNSWIIILIWLYIYIALNRTPNICIYTVTGWGQYPSYANIPGSTVMKAQSLGMPKGDHSPQCLRE